MCCGYSCCNSILRVLGDDASLQREGCLGVNRTQVEPVSSCNHILFNERHFYTRSMGLHFRRPVVGWAAQRHATEK